MAILVAAKLGSGLLTDRQWCAPIQQHSHGEFASAFIAAFVMSMWYMSDSHFNKKVMSFGALYQALFKQSLGLSP